MRLPSKPPSDTRAYLMPGKILPAIMSRKTSRWVAEQGVYTMYSVLKRQYRRTRRVYTSAIKRQYRRTRRVYTSALKRQYRRTRRVY